MGKRKQARRKYGLDMQKVGSIATRASTTQTKTLPQVKDRAVLLSARKDVRYYSLVPARFACKLALELCWLTNSSYSQRREAVNERFDNVMAKRKVMGLAPPKSLVATQKEELEEDLPEAEGTSDAPVSLPEVLTLSCILQ
jgi:hypothetical protein